MSLAESRLDSSSLPSPSFRTIGGIGELAAAISTACFDCADAKRDRVIAALKRAAADPHLLSADQRQASAETYARHVIYGDPAGRFTILAIVWGPGQFSPPHAHHAWCAYAVHDLALEEGLFRWSAETETAEPVRTEARVPGYACYAGPGLEQIHRLGNPGTKPAISIHVYGVESDRVGSHVNRRVDLAHLEDKNS